MLALLVGPRVIIFLVLRRELLWIDREGDLVLQVSINAFLGVFKGVFSVEKHFGGTTLRNRPITTGLAGYARVEVVGGRLRRRTTQIVLFGRRQHFR